VIEIMIGYAAVAGDVAEADGSTIADRNAGAACSLAIPSILTAIVGIDHTIERSGLSIDCA
jgi:hypothetical protein